MRGAIEGYFYRVLGFFARGSWKSKEGGAWYDSRPRPSIQFRSGRGSVGPASMSVSPKLESSTYNNHRK